MEVALDNGEVAEVSLPDKFWTTCPELSTSLSLRIIMLLAEPWNLTKTKDLYRLQAPSYVFDQKDKGHLQKE